MTKVMLTMSMSLDGFVAGPNVNVEHAMGEGGERLHDWLFNRNPQRSGNSVQGSPNAVDTKVTQETFATTGAVILGRRTFDVGLQHWNDTPYPVPCFVLTHRPHEKLKMPSGTFTFVTDGITSALRQATAAAGDKHINLMGADIAQQFLKAGLLDEIELNLVPVLLGNGLRLFENFGMDKVELESTRVLESNEVTHLRFRPVKRAP